jgi:RimJ/RimL family protein N-acetyltransferase
VTGPAAEPVIETERLVLRPWSEADRAAYIALAIDPVVSTWLGGTPTTQAAEAAFEHLRGASAAVQRQRWALARNDDGVVVGAVSLDIVPGGRGHPLAGAVEIGWGLFPHAWGQGYASEGAAAALAWGFANLAVDEIVSFTAASNARSEAVMRRIGLMRDAGRDFDHPDLAADHPLRPHIVYHARRPG